MNDSLNNIRTLFLRLLPIQIFVVMSSYLSNIINGLVIGNYLSPGAMIGLGLVTPVLNIITSVSMIVAGGAGILCGNYMGKGESDKVNQVYSISLEMLVISGVVISLCFFMAAEPLAHFLKASSEAFPETVAYIRGVAASILPMLVMPLLMTFLQMCNKSSVSLVSMIALGALNAVLGLLNIHVLHYGIFGIGVTTSLSRYVVVIGMLLYIGRHKELLEYKRGSFEGKMAGDILKYGSPGALSGLLYAVRNMALNTYAAQVGGDIAVNALAILGASCGFFDALNVGTQNTLTMTSSVFVGERDAESVKRSMYMCILAGIPICIIRFIITYPFGTPFAMLFGAKGDVIPAAVTLLRYYTWSAPFNFFTIAIMSVYQVLGRARFCNMIFPFHCLVTPMLCCIFLTKVIGINGIWACYMISEIVTLAFFVIRTVIRKKKFPVTLMDIIDLPADFEPANKFTVTIKDVDGVINVSKRLEAFCKEHGIDDKRAMIAGLCMEEMADDIVEHGFPKTKGYQTVDIFACVENNEVLMRLRDNCVPFDPHSRIPLFNPKDPEKYLGIKLVSEMAKEMKYQANLGMNVLTVTI
ncbi:MAG: ATP-binding protein [Solobacterium sp.]|nr:ATP-binding protein [Solobacterium sp.]